jgi:hypothetical protein
LEPREAFAADEPEAPRGEADAAADFAEAVGAVAAAPVPAAPGLALPLLPLEQDAVPIVRASAASAAVRVVTRMVYVSAAVQLG